MTRARAAGRVTFAALSVPNYRRYIAGQAVSLSGTWMQMAAQSWLVLTLSHSRHHARRDRRACRRCRCCCSAPTAGSSPTASTSAA